MQKALQLRLYLVPKKIKDEIWIYLTHSHSVVVYCIRESSRLCQFSYSNGCSQWLKALMIEMNLIRPFRRRKKKTSRYLNSSDNIPLRLRSHRVHSSLWASAQKQECPQRRQEFYRYLLDGKRTSKALLRMVIISESHSNINAIGSVFTCGISRVLWISFFSRSVNFYQKGATKWGFSTIQVFWFKEHGNAMRYLYKEEEKQR